MFPYFQILPLNLSRRLESFIRSLLRCESRSMRNDEVERDTLFRDTERDFLDLWAVFSIHFGEEFVERIGEERSLSFVILSVFEGDGVCPVQSSLFSPGRLDETL
jgi:hypothetical protein